MKVLLFVFLLLSLGASAQTANQAKNLCLNPACPISYAYGSTDTVFVEINASDGNGVSYWRQISGPTVKLPKDTAIWVTSIQAFDGFYLSGLTPGTYTLQDSVVTKAGSIATQQVTFTVLAPPPACPVCPTIPAPRMVTSVSFTLFGQNVTIPASALPAGSIKFNDGTTQ